MANRHEDSSANSMARGPLIIKKGIRPVLTLATHHHTTESAVWYGKCPRSLVIMAIMELISSSAPSPFPFASIISQGEGMYRHIIMALVKCQNYFLTSLFLHYYLIFPCFSFVLFLHMWLICLISLIKKLPGIPPL